MNAALEAAWRHAETFALDANGPRPTTIDDAWREGHVVLTTSGSTGAPKRVVLARDRAERLARVLTAAQDNDDVASVVVALPLHYSFALVNQWLWARLHDRPIAMTAGLRDPRSLAEALDRAPRSMLCLVGAQIALLARTLDGATFPNVCRLHFAGGPFPQAAWPTIRDLFPRAIVTNNYGCTEAGPRLTCRVADEADDPRDVGQPLPGVSLRTSARGTIELRSPYAAVALEDEHGALRAIATDEWIDTGDLGESTAAGTWRVLGREGDIDLVKRYGEKVSRRATLDLVARTWRGAASCELATDERGEPGFGVVLAPAPNDTELRAILGSIREISRAHWPLWIDAAADVDLSHAKVDFVSSGGASRTRIWRQR